MSYPYPESRGSSEPVIPDGSEEDAIPFLELVRREAAAAAKEQFDKDRAGIQQEAVDYARDVGFGALTGRGTPNLVPDISVTTTTGKELTIASAKNRSFRTFVQGFGIDLGVALIALLGLAFTNFDFFDKAAWITLLGLVIKTVIQTGISYVARLKITPNYDKPLEALPDSLPGEQIAA